MVASYYEAQHCLITFSPGASPQLLLNTHAKHIHTSRSTLVPMHVHVVPFYVADCPVLMPHMHRKTFR